MLHVKHKCKCKQIFITNKIYQKAKNKQNKEKKSKTKICIRRAYPHIFST